jgi:hypothetical protein
MPLIIATKDMAYAAVSSSSQRTPSGTISIVTAGVRPPRANS